VKSTLPSIRSCVTLITIARADLSVSWPLVEAFAKTVALLARRSAQDALARGSPP
jgi:hypothetical protein